MSMTRQLVTLARLTQLAHAGNHRPAVDTARNVAYLRRGRVMYEAPLTPAPSPDST